MNTAIASNLQRALDRWVLFGPSLGVNATLDDAMHGVWHGASGYSDPQTREPMPALALCYVYSITKTFIAVRVLQLAEDARLDLDAPISAYVEDLAIPDGVTIRRLLNHTAGVPSYTDLPDYMDAVRASPSRPWSYDEVRKRTCGGKLDFAPGEGWHYSNTGYMLLAKLIERLGGGSFGEEIAKGIVDPLGLKHTRVAEHVDDGKLTPCYARELDDDRRVREVSRLYHPWWCLTGLVASTTAQTAAFYTGLMSGALLEPSSLAAMRQGVPAGSDENPSWLFRKPRYGLGLMMDAGWDNGGWYGHGGSGPGFATFAMVLPDFHGRRLTLAAFCNTSIGGTPENLLRDLLRVMENG